MSISYVKYEVSIHYIEIALLPWKPRKAAKQRVPELKRTKSQRTQYNLPCWKSHLGVTAINRDFYFSLSLRRKKYFKSYFMIQHPNSWARTQLPSVMIFYGFGLPPPGNTRESVWGLFGFLDENLEVLEIRRLTLLPICDDPSPENFISSDTDSLSLTD